MTPELVFTIIALYFILLIVIGRLTSRHANTQVFFTANRQSPWFVVAFGMIGASLSGITFISVPGEVGNSNFEYLQMVFGYLAGYVVIATILMPLYYRLNLVTIYGYLLGRFGFWSYKTGAFFFLLSRTVGSAFRLFLVAGVLQIAIFRAWGVPFWVTVLITILLIWVYTYKGGIKTIVWTDTLQTLFMLVAVVVSIIIILQSMEMGIIDIPGVIAESKYANVFEWDWKAERNFFKQFLAGAFITIVMTGLDQDMMQKNLTCRNIRDAQKNMFWFSIILVLANVLFLTLGALLYLYSENHGVGIPGRTDDLFPLLALNHFSVTVGVLFILGIVAAAYSSADSALTALTTSFCVDFLNFDDRMEEKQKHDTRVKVHIGFSILIFGVIMLFSMINDDSVITSLFKAAGYTYGPLLGLFSFGMLTKKAIKDQWAPWVCFISPVISYLINLNSEAWLGGYRFGFEILILNGLLTFLGLWAISRSPIQSS
ncbi:MAG: sodium:solute symporter [Cyclobacteriaceae bacterium]|nr:sodium:solute symporter [Cyclobacteriaceae bacterium]